MTTRVQTQRATPKADSPGECALALHLRAHGIDFEREVCLIPGRKWRVDFFVKPSLVVEVHGAIWQQGKHARGGGLERDYAKMNAHVMAGYSPLQFSTGMVESGEAIKIIMQLVGNPSKMKESGAANAGRILPAVKERA